MDGLILYRQRLRRVIYFGQQSKLRELKSAIIRKIVNNYAKCRKVKINDKFVEEC